MSALRPLTRPRRPPVLDAARTALIPLRPLTIGEILDGAFLIVRRNLRLMLGLPLVVAAGAAAYALAGVGLWGASGQHHRPLGLDRAHSADGPARAAPAAAVPGLADRDPVPGEPADGARRGVRPGHDPGHVAGVAALSWPMLGMSLLQWAAVSVVQTLLGILYYVLTIGVVLAGVESETLAAVSLIGITLVTYALYVVIYGYLSLTLPAMATESAKAPGWIGKPAKPTNPLTAFERSVRLVGKRNVVRVGLVYGGLLLICLAVIGLVAAGVVLMITLYARALNADILDVLANPWTIFGVVAFSVLVAMSVLLAYAAAVQTLVYLDLRMRREALDLAMRFDCVPIPQPSAPPPAYLPWVPPPVPLAPPPG